MRYVAYYRVSTQEQGRSGLGLDAQEQAVQLHVRSRAGEIVGSFIEVESGRKSDRPQLALAMDLAIEQHAVLLIAKLDRLARSVHFISTLLLDPKLEIEACDLPAANKMTMQIMAAVAEGEAAAISHRTKVALKHAKRRGVKLGMNHDGKAHLTSSYGKKGAVTKQIEADRLAAELGKMIEEMRVSGMTFKQIAARFSLLGVPMERKKARPGETKWSLSRIYQIYRRYKFIGPMPYGQASLPTVGVGSQKRGTIRKDG